MKPIYVIYVSIIEVNFKSHIVQMKLIKPLVNPDEALPLNPT